MEHFDIAAIIPLEEELHQFVEHFPSVEDRSTKTMWCHVVDSGKSNISIIVVQQQGMGKTNAVNAANLVLQKYSIGLLVCIGIAGSLSDDIKLCDVCYSVNVIDVLDNAKAIDSSEHSGDTELSPTFYNTPLEFYSSLNFMRTQPKYKKIYKEWQSERREWASSIMEKSAKNNDSNEIVINEPNTKNGSIVCGMVSKSKNYNEKLRAIDRALLAIETESGGVFAQGKYHNDVPALAIRGISDYADMGKKKLEKISNGAIREIAASNAASFLKLNILYNENFISALEGRKIVNPDQLLLPTLQKGVDKISEIIEFLSSIIRQALRKFSPEYKLQEKGYHLPLPRVRRVFKDDSINFSETSEPIEILDAIERQDRILIGVPRTYPDQSLAWIIADNLLSEEINGKQVIPIVINGEDIRGKNATFCSVVDVEIDAVLLLEGAEIVFIIDNIPFSSKHRLEAIFSQIEEYAEKKFIFMIRGDNGVIEESEFESRSSAIAYQACPISFIEIAYFIQKNFEMTDSEAEVVALRLRDTFERFDLDAHPTYFAGIPKQTLSALLQANRRSELIQLAVDGFLTILVAADKADVTLSRSTRARFLRKLVVEMKVEKKNFDQAGIISFAKSFADYNDFDINPMEFVTKFVDQGIIHFESEKAKISLPFIESYLLASELSSNSILSEKYFNVYDSDFDMETFDIYAEIGASPAVIENVLGALNASCDELSRKNTGEHILLGETIYPENIRRLGRAENLKKRLSAAVKSVRDGISKTSEKQQLLDLSDKIRAATGKQREVRSRRQNEGAADEGSELLSNASRHWGIATVLLGSGAEHLDAKTKRALSSIIIKGSALVIDEWSRVRKNIDFQSLKKELTTDESLADLPGPDNIVEKRRFVEGIIDLLEYSAMADPLRRVTGFLCEQARHRVLAPSVENADIKETVEAIIRGTWLADIDAARGVGPLREAIKCLPRATFFRIALASHYLARVYWAHWKKEDRLALLEAAQEVIKPLDVNINKSELKRYIKKK